MLCAAVMRNDGLFVLRLEGVELASEFAQCGLGVAKAEGARLFERTERGGDARQGSFVGRNVEICYRMGDELGQKSAGRTKLEGYQMGVLLLQGLHPEALLRCG
jgi:hypothetical protein